LNDLKNHQSLKSSKDNKEKLKPTKKFEYLTLNNNKENITDSILNKYGEEGWELIGLTLSDHLVFLN